VTFIFKFNFVAKTAKYITHEALSHFIN
jgi:hypothetical protein